MRAIEVDGLTKIYRLYHSPQDRLKELVSPSRKKYHREFYALKDISISVERGETIGIVGQNGSGKSTLLKILTGVIRPTSGRVSVNGRVSSLLELGAGFNFEFTGRDNVYMTGALMGFSRREMDRRFPAIDSFADIGEYIDQPVRTYSSGMYMRLAFSAAINVDPDVLIVDEVLAVGDENFQTKCRRKIQDLRQSGKTILLVSHDTFTIENICSGVYLLDHGRCMSQGTPQDVLPTYKSIVQSRAVPAQVSSEQVNATSLRGAPLPEQFGRWGTRDVEITGVYFVDRDGKRVADLRIEPNGSFAFRIEFAAHKRIERPVFGMAIHRNDGIDVSRTNTRMSHLEISSIEGDGVIECVVERLPLLPGQFSFTAAVSDYDVFVMYDIWYKCLSFTVSQSESIKERAGVLLLTSRWDLLRS